MSIEVIIGGLLAIFGVIFGYKQWAKDQGAAEREYKRRKQQLERAKERTQRQRERLGSDNQELRQQEEELQQQIDELNTKIIGEKETHEENLDRLEEMDSDERDRRANELLHG